MFLNICNETSVIPKGFQMKRNFQLDGDKEEQRKCEEVRDGTALILVDLSREIYKRKCSNLQDEINVRSIQIDLAAGTEIDRWAVNDRRRLDFWKKRKVSRSKNWGLNCIGEEIRYKVLGTEKDGNVFTYV